MIGVGRKGLQQSFTRALSSCLIQTQPAHFPPSATILGAACMHSNPLPYQQLSSMKRSFAATANEDYNSDGQMSAVTFHGPRTMKVSQKPKPKLETSGVSTPRMQYRHKMTSGTDMLMNTGNACLTQTMQVLVQWAFKHRTYSCLSHLWQFQHYKISVHSAKFCYEHAHISCHCRPLHAAVPRSVVLQSTSTSTIISCCRM